MNDYSDDGIIAQFVPRKRTIILAALFALGMTFADLSAMLPDDDVKEQPSAIATVEEQGHTE